MQLAVLNPGGRDREQAFPNFAGAPDDKAVHPPINYHAYAACTGGTFYRDAARIPRTLKAVLLVVRRDLNACLKALRKLKGQERRVAVSLKESGLHQVAQLLGTARNLEVFREICGGADGCLASTQEMVGVYEAAGGKRVEFIPTPYPVDSVKWDFGRRLVERSGMFIGTREWETPSRNHAAALLVAARLGTRVTVVNEDGRAGRNRIKGAGIGDCRIIEGRLPYPDYLRLMAEHRIVLQLDRSAVPGQVAGDALLCGMPCVGGDGALERIVFPGLCGFGRETGEIAELAGRLLGDDGTWEGAVEGARKIARERVSFGAVEGEIGRFYAGMV